MIGARCACSSAGLRRAGPLLAVLIVLGVAAGSAAAQSIAVPAYFYPGGSPNYWTQLDQAGPGTLAVLNPSSGPGSGPDPNYLSAVRSAEAAGITVVGYVYTNYGNRSLSAVESDVTKYYSWYPVQGIFFDQASTSCTKEAYYAQLNSYVKALSVTAHTVLNPGTQTDQCYAAAADTLLTFEGTASEYTSSYSAPSWVSSYPASHFWHVIYGASTTSAMATAVQLSKTRNAGYVYVTSATLPNPYNVLPTVSYWSTELSDIGAASALSAPTNSGAPAVSGVVSQGQVLSGSSGSWGGNPMPTYTYQWEDCSSTGGSCVKVSGATGSTYTLTANDVGHTVVVVVTATNSQGQASASSAPTGVVQAALSAPTNSGAPAVSGVVSQGQVLSGSSGSWGGNPMPTYTYQWEDCSSTGGSCVKISGATGSTYTLTANDVGHTIVVVVTATNSQGQASASSAPTSVVQASASGPSLPKGFLGGDYAVEGGAISLSGTGQALATRGTISSTGTLSDMFVYQAAGVSGSPTIEAAVYADNNGYPGAQIGDAATNALNGAGWLDMGGLQVGSARTLGVTGGEKVWVIIHVQGSGTLSLAEKGGCSGQGWRISNSPTWLDDPWTTGAAATSDCSVSAYVTG